MTIRQGVDVDKAMMLAKFRVSRFTLSASSGGSNDQSGCCFEPTATGSHRALPPCARVGYSRWICASREFLPSVDTAIQTPRCCQWQRRAMRRSLVWGAKTPTAPRPGAVGVLAPEALCSERRLSRKFVDEGSRTVGLFYWFSAWSGRRSSNLRPCAWEAGVHRWEGERTRRMSRAIGAVADGGELPVFVAMNNFKVVPEREADFEQIWKTRETYLQSVPGFVHFMLLRGDQVGEYISHSTWENREAFLDWTRSESFVKGHQQGSLQGDLGWTAAGALVRCGSARNPEGPRCRRQLARCGPPADRSRALARRRKDCRPPNSAILHDSLSRES